MDLVGHLASEDPMFDSFMKMSLREKPAGKVVLLYFLDYPMFFILYYF